MKELALFTEKIFGRYAIYFRYLISGGSAFTANIVALYVLTEYLEIYYLVSTPIAFFIGFIVSFIMMKHWTFQDNSVDGVHRQFVLYLVVTFFNLLLNTALMYLFVERVGVWYMLAQVFASLIIAV